MSSSSFKGALERALVDGQACIQMACFRGVGNFQPPSPCVRATASLCYHVRELCRRSWRFCRAPNKVTSPFSPLRPHKKIDGLELVSAEVETSAWWLTDSEGRTPLHTNGLLANLGFFSFPSLPSVRFSRYLWLWRNSSCSRLLLPSTCAAKLSTRIADFRVNDGWRTCQLYGRNKWFPKPHPIAYSPLSSITQSFNKHNFTYCKYQRGVFAFNQTFAQNRSFCGGFQWKVRKGSGFWIKWQLISGGFGRGLIGRNFFLYFMYA